MRRLTVLTRVERCPIPKELKIRPSGAPSPHPTTSPPARSAESRAPTMMSPSVQPAESRAPTRPPLDRTAEVSFRVRPRLRDDGIPPPFSCVPAPRPARGGKKNIVSFSIARHLESGVPHRSLVASVLCKGATGAPSDDPPGGGPTMALFLWPTEVSEFSVTWASLLIGLHGTYHPFLSSKGADEWAGRAPIPHPIRQCNEFSFRTAHEGESQIACKAPQVAVRHNALLTAANTGNTGQSL